MWSCKYLSIWSRDVTPAADLQVNISGLKINFSFFKKNNHIYTKAENNLQQFNICRKQRWCLMFDPKVHSG